MMVSVGALIYLSNLVNSGTLWSIGLDRLRLLSIEENT